MSNNWLWETAANLGRGIGSGEIDPVDLTQTYLEAIEVHEFGPRIYARTTADRALAEAEAASERAKAGLRRSPLDGVPISWKDLFDTSGTICEAGSDLLSGRVPTTDAEVVKNATAAGLVGLGKTHMSELAFSGLGVNPVKETSPCVNDHAAVAGGSSSGAATSVAFGLAAAGIGSDTGGSVRIPAAWNDLVGLKTTSGRLSLKGVVPLCASFDTVGPLCRSVEDANLMLAALEGGKPANLDGASLVGKRFLILDTIAMEEVRDAPKSGFDTACDALKNAGAHVENGTMEVVHEAMQLTGVLYSAEAYGTWSREIEADPEKMFPPILARFMAGKDVLASDYVKAWQRLAEIREIYAAKTAGYDAVIMPSSAILPPNVARLLTEDGYFNTENLLALRNTRIGNLMGSASLTLPTSTPSAGIMFTAGPMSEHKLLRIGAAAEAALA